MKTCTSCELEKTLDCFKKTGKTKIGTQRYKAICVQCVAKRDREYKRRPDVKAAQAARQKDPNGSFAKALKIRRDIVWEYLKSHPCVDCGEPDPLVLEFDHVRGKKSSNISQMIVRKLKLETLLEEIEKCDIRCANCHRRVTYERQGSWRFLAI